MIQNAPSNSLDRSATDKAVIQPLLIGVDDFAAILQVSNRTIWRLVSSGEAPAPLRIGGSCRWRLEEVTNWIDLDCPAQHQKATPLLSK